MANNLVSTNEVDYLEADPALRGQNFVCLSFISPEDVIKKKEAYFFEEFIKNFSDDMTEFFDRLSEKYVDELDVIRSIKERYTYIFNKSSIYDEYQYFLNDKSAPLEQLYYEQNQFQTTIRGLKVRGVFDTMREADIRCQVLKKMDPVHNVFVAQVGMWCPWSPNPNDIEDQQYAETHLNTLMKNYKDNQNKKDIFYEERKRELQLIKTKKTLEGDDPWIANKSGEEVVSPEVPAEVVTAEPQTEVVTPEVSTEVVSPEAPVEVVPAEVQAEAVPEAAAEAEAVAEAVASEVIE